MNALLDLVSSLSGAIVVIAAFSVSATFLVGRSRKRRWNREVAELEQAEGESEEIHVQRVRNEQRASDFLSSGMHRIYYMVTIFSSIGLLVLPYLSFEQSTLRIAKLGLTGMTFFGALILLVYWRGSNDEGEDLLRRKLRQAQERAHARRGLAVRDEVTGAYTLDYWLHALELRTRRFIWKQIPMTCLMLDVEGLPELRARRGSEVGDDALILVGNEITRNVRARDLVARYRGQRFVIALYNCPARLGERIAERVATNIEYLSLRGANKQYGSDLHLRWSLASMPKDASTPIQLLRVTETTLDLKKSLIPAVGRLSASPADQRA